MADSEARVEDAEQEVQEDLEQYHDAQENLKDQEISEEREGLKGQQEWNEEEGPKDQSISNHPTENGDLDTKTTTQPCLHQANDWPNNPGSYAAARCACIRDFLAIVTQCRQNNEKFTDPEYDVLEDFRQSKNFIYGLPRPLSKGGGGDVRPFANPGSVHRIVEVMERAEFAKGAGRGNSEALREEMDTGSGEKKRIWEGKIVAVMTGLFSLATSVLLLLGHGLANNLKTATVALIVASGLAALAVSYRQRTRCPQPRFFSSDIKQSDELGNCWFISAIGSLAGHTGLLQRICVAWDQDCGVYGFLLYRDGAWTHTLVDDYVYLRNSDFTPDSSSSRHTFEQRSKAHKAANQTGPDALHFAKCRKAQHTWLPLLEKAYAKVHGDYEALEGGFTFEALQDLTGGVASYIRTDSIADQDALWRQLRQGRGDVVFGIGSLLGRHSDTDEGLPLAHEFAIEGAYEFPRFEGFRLRKTRLLKIRNPWGTKGGLWQGSWSAGCANWSLLATWWLQPQLHEEGVFFMTLEDALETFPDLAIVRIIDAKKSFTQQKWAAVRVQRRPMYPSPLLQDEYSPVFFRLRLTRNCPVTLTVSQLDPRYFAKLQAGQTHGLDIVVRKVAADNENSPASPFIARTCSRANYMRPPLHLSLDLSLDVGTYEVLLQLSPLQEPQTNKLDIWTRSDLYQEYCYRQTKILQISRNFNVAFQKLENVDPRLDMGRVWPLLGRHEQAEGGVCGVGLRVFSEDEGMKLEVGWTGVQGEEEVERGRSSRRRSSAASGKLMDVWQPPASAKSRSRSGSQGRGWDAGDRIDEDDPWGGHGWGANVDAETVKEDLGWAEDGWQVTSGS